MDNHFNHIRQDIIIYDFEALSNNRLWCRRLIKCLQKGCFEVLNPALECISLEQLVNLF